MELINPNDLYESIRESCIKAGEWYNSAKDSVVRTRAEQARLTFGECLLRIESQERIDAEPVKHGRWEITDAYPHNVYCSECHKKFAQTHWTVWEDGSLPRNFCPNCGSKMNLEDAINE